MLINYKAVLIFTILHGILAQREILLFDDLGNECLTDVDLMLLLDGSGSVKPENFEVVKEWVKHVARSLDIDRGFVRIGVVQYSSYYPQLPMEQQPYIKTEIKLGNYTNLLDFEDAVNKIKHQGYQTYTAHAINKTLEVDFSEFPPNRYPNARRALILVTDGKALDSEDLEEIVEKAENEFGVNMYAVGVGNYQESELHLITHNHKQRVFKLENFDELTEIVASLERDVHESCDCDRRGSVNDSCEVCSLQCNCHVYVEGRRCDKCFDDYYGIGSGIGCFPCNCNLFGSTNTSCDIATGQCDCVTDPPAFGRRCNRCGPQSYGTYPECRDCECNGFSPQCNARTGECIDCEGGRIGFNCERCPAGYFLAGSGECVACECNGNTDPNDPDACDPITGVCTGCLHDTAGESCEECKDGYFGDARNQSCQRCECDLSGTDASTCVGEDCTCEKLSGQCDCLPNLTGRICGECTLDHWRAGLTEGCIECQCSEAGSQAGTSCNQETGQCVCKEEYTGQRCSDCAEGYERNDDGSDSGDECSQIQPTTIPATTTTTTTTTAAATTTTTATTAATTTTSAATTTTTAAATASNPTTTSNSWPSTTRKTLPVNPNWRPCNSCGRRRWPSFCQGWYCRRRWPYTQFYPSQQRCYSWNWGCRANFEYSASRSVYQQQQQPSRNYMNTQYRRPQYYRGYYHHARSNRRAPVRYNLYRNH